MVCDGEPQTLGSKLKLGQKDKLVVPSTISALTIKKSKKK